MTQPDGAAAEVFAGAGECAALARTVDWAATPLGPVSSWPRSLRTAVGICLASELPLMICWGPEFVQIYNDSYRQILGAKHPGGMGQRADDCWPEIRDFLMPLLEGVGREGRKSWLKDQLLPVTRNGFVEEAYFTIAHSPIPDDDGRIGGVFHSSVETTQEVVSRRRLHVLRALASAAGGGDDVDGAYAAAIRALDGSMDVPVAIALRRRAEGAPLAPLASAGLALPADAPALAAFEEVARSGAPRLFAPAELLAGTGFPPLGPVLVVPLSEGERAGAGVLVLAASSRRPFDADHRGFLDLAAAHAARGIDEAVRVAAAHDRAERLADLDRAKTAFFANVSHELRTPLTLILGPLDDLAAGRAGPLPDAARAELAVVRRNAERLLGLVNALLDFARIESGQVEASFEPTELAALTADLASAFRAVAERAGLGFEVDVAPLSEPAFVDREAWEKIVLNLLSNAFKFTFEGRVAIRLAERDGRAVLTVEDSGIGIPEPELPRVFERFHRVHGARSRSDEGTGIGLAMVHDLAQLHGGTATVASGDGEGTRFEVVVPLGSSHLPAPLVRASLRTWEPEERATVAAADALRWVPQPAVEVPRREGARAGRVLVADDNPDLRAYLARVLGSSFDVVTAADGQEALEAARTKGTFDAVVTDIMMPRLDGFGLLRALRHDPVTRGLPVIMLSARAGEEESVEGLDAGADDYLAKPFGARELLARVRSTMALARMRRELAARDAVEAQLAAALRARDDFLVIAAHELRTPVTALALQLQLAARSPAPHAPEGVERFAAVQRQVRRLTRLVEELVNVSQITTGGLTLDLAEADLSALVETVLAERAEDLARAGIVLATRVEPAVVVGCDAPRLRQTVATLLDNALKYGAGRPLEVELGRELRGVRLAVVDRGRGVSVEDRARIFGRFERAVSTREYGGFGLGLWIARQVVDAHGGSITVADTRGGGATFEIVLPISG